MTDNVRSIRRRYSQHAAFVKASLLPDNREVTRADACAVRSAAIHIAGPSLSSYFCKSVREVRIIQSTAIMAN